MRRSRPPHAAAGFTLVEVLVALLIMAVLAGLAWRGMDAIARTRDITQARMERTLRVDTVLQQWEQDLLNVQDNPLVPALSFDGATLRLLRQTDAGVQIVAWSVRDGRWLRWPGPVVTRAAALQDSWMRSQQLLGNEPTQLVTLEGVSGWQVYFYRGNSWSNPQSSNNVTTVFVPSAPSSGASGNGTGGATGSAGGAGNPQQQQQQRQVLPTGVRIVMTFAGADNGTLMRDVLLGPQTP